MKELHKFQIKRWLRPMVIAFVVPVLILLLLYIIRGIFPFGERIYVRMDFYHQYAPFMKEFVNHIRNGESLLYAWEYGLGTNYWAHYAYYLASPWNLLLLLVPTDYIIEAMNVTMVLRAGVAGASFVYFLKEDRKEKVAMAAFGIFYALCGYYIAYSCNIIWMDGFALFPLVALGVSRIVKGKSALLYTVSMLICTFSNFYLAVIMGMCCVIWLLLCLVSRRHLKIKEFFVVCASFTGHTVLYVAMCAVIMLPVVYALSNTPAGDSTFPTEAEFYYSFYEVFERMLMNTDSVLKGSELPNIYASVLAVVLLPLFFCNKTIRIKEKIAYGLVLAFMLVSFWCNIPDYIWHGFHFPNSFPARQAFFFVFLLLAMGYRAYERRKRLAPAVICVTVPMMLIFVGVLWYFLGKDTEKFGILIYGCSAIFVLIYGILLFAEKYMPYKIYLCMFVGICCLEAGINTCVGGIASVVNRASYMEDDAKTEVILEEIRPLSDEFYRIEDIDRRYVNEAAWDFYPGASYFSSTMPGGAKEWFDAFGMRNSSVSYSYDGATPLVASLLGVKYVYACDDEYLPGDTFVENRREVNGEEAFFYENTTVLPLGYMVDSDLEYAFEYDYGNPFHTQNLFAEAVLGEGNVLFTTVAQDRENIYPEQENAAGAEQDMDTTAEVKECVTIHIKAGDNVFLYVTTWMEAIEVEITDVYTGEITTVKYDDLKFKKIISLGGFESDKVISITSADESVSEVKFYSYKINDDVLRAVCDKLGEQPMEITFFEDTKVTGVVKVNEAGALFVSVPYDAGWQVKVDGETADTYAWKGAFLALELEEGTHEVEFRYCPAGFREGLVISFCGLGAFLLLFVFPKMHARKRKKMP